jgi:hypothetical protein
MLEVKAEAYPSETPFRGFTLGQAPGLAKLKKLF